MGRLARTAVATFRTSRSTFSGFTGCGILIALMDVYRLPIVADEPLVGEHPSLGPRRGHHLDRQPFKVGKFTRL
jgi:hypothetical protein